VSTFVALGGTRVEYATLSGQGARSYNEDACGYWTSPQASCFVVCDGAGGHGGGEVASETAVRTLLSAFSAAPSLDPEHIASLISQTDTAIRYGQKLTASGVRRGTAGSTGSGRHWLGAAGPVSWSVAKGDAVAVLEALGVALDRVQIVRGAPGWYHPGRSGVIQQGPQNVLAHFGELHPSALEALDAQGPMVAFEVFLDAIPEPKAKPTKSKGALAASELMPLSRDFAFVVDEKVEAEKILKAVRGADRQLITDAGVFDVFRGPSIGEGKKSVAVEVSLQPTQATLTDKDLEALAQKIVAAVTKATGASLRA